MVVAAQFGRDPAGWTEGTRSDDPSRAAAAYLARRRFGYAAREVAEALGYRSHGGVRNALARIEAAGPRLHVALEALERQLVND